MTPLELLTCAQDLLANPDRWIQGSMCQSKHNHVVNFGSPQASKFSLEGALFRVAYITRSPLEEALDFVALAIHPRKVISLANFNDAKGTSWLAVQGVLNAAIIRAGGKARDFTPSEDE